MLELVDACARPPAWARRTSSPSSRPPAWRAAAQLPGRRRARARARLQRQVEPRATGLRRDARAGRAADGVVATRGGGAMARRPGPRSVAIAPGSAGGAGRRRGRVRLARGRPRRWREPGGLRRRSRSRGAAAGPEELPARALAAPLSSGRRRMRRLARPRARRRRRSGRARCLPALRRDEASSPCRRPVGLGALLAPCGRGRPDLRSRSRSCDRRPWRCESRLDGWRLRRESQCSHAFAGYPPPARRKRVSAAQPQPLDGLRRCLLATPICASQPSSRSAFSTLGQRRTTSTSKVGRCSSANASGSRPHASQMTRAISATVSSSRRARC